MSTPTRKCGLVFHPCLSLDNEDHHKEYSLTRFKQLSNCGFREISSQCSTIPPYICKVKKNASNQASK